jgi:ubiquinone/menaquinone biosynthesis C-methylase UbiE
VTTRPEKDAMQFYEDLADDYDLMTSFDERQETVRETISLLVEQYGIKSAVDAGCGSGLYSIIMAQLGLQVVGADISGALLKRAKENAKKLKANPKFILASFQNLKDELEDKYDAVFCLGNSIPHLLTRQELDESLLSFFTILKKGGMAIIELLNYDRVLEDKERVVGVRNVGDRIFVRFYDFFEDHIQFNIVRTIVSEKDAQSTLHSTTLNPYRIEEIGDSLRKGGFCHIDFFGSLGLAPYDVRTSTNLVAVAKK